MILKYIKSILPGPETALPGRDTEQPLLNQHYVTGHPIREPFDESWQIAVFALGCFWGAERKFWQLPGVLSTAVGYTAGLTPNPTYDEVCTGLTAHTEAVKVIFDPANVRYEQLLKVFWESHNPTQGMRQGNDVGTQYRSGIYTLNAEQHAQALASRDHYQQKLSSRGLPEITTEILALEHFYYAETYHQQYLAKNPSGYCGLGGCAVDYD